MGSHPYKDLLRSTETEGEKEQSSTEKEKAKRKFQKTLVGDIKTTIDRLDRNIEAIEDSTLRMETRLAILSGEEVDS